MLHEVNQEPNAIGDEMKHRKDESTCILLTMRQVDVLRAGLSTRDVSEPFFCKFEKELGLIDGHCCCNCPRLATIVSLGPI